MALHRGGTESTMTDVLDRVLDKGIVFDAWERMSRAGIELISTKVHLVVSSIQTRLDHEWPYATNAGAVHDAAAQADDRPRSTVRRSARRK
jgi:hypothetical protein